MAKRKIIWSHKAKIKLTEILDFYYQRTQSKSYSSKLYHELHKSTKLLLKQPALGIRTEIDSVRALII